MLKFSWFARGASLILLAVALLLVAACAPGSVSSVTSRAPTPTVTTAATRTTADALSRIHNITPDGFTLFASISFTIDTTYDQATAILRGHVYLWMCDEPRSNTPPTLAEQQANFVSGRYLLMSYPNWDELVRIASTPQVVSVEDASLYPCP